MNDTFVSAIQAANTVLLTTPEAVDLDTDKNSIRWSINSAATIKARKDLRKILGDLWQSGAYNYEQIAKSLRLSEFIVQALMDEQFIEAKGL